MLLADLPATPVPPQHFLTLTRVRPSDLTMNVYEGAYHDLHHDPETPAVLAAAVAWLRPRVA